MFAMEDVNFLGLIEQIRRRSNSISARLWQSLSKEDQFLLDNYEPLTSNAKRAQEVVLGSLNKFIEGPYVYPEQFTGIVWRGETKGLMQQDPKGPKLARLNRLLLEDAYPLELSRSLKAGSKTINKGDPITLTISFTNASITQTFYMLTSRNIEDDTQYSFTVITPSGKQIAPHANPRGAFSGGHRTLAANGTIQFTFALSKVCSFDEIGDYIISATRIMEQHGEKESFFKVVSNPLKIAVVAVH
jgi:hypothetical protein